MTARKLRTEIKKMWPVNDKISNKVIDDISNKVIDDIKLFLRSWMQN
jgi:hypothetical protein